MSQPTDPFDPYFEWLDIAPQDQPPTYYRLLGVQEFEPDLAVIERAAKARTAHLHPMSSGPKRDSVQILLREIAKARRTLLSQESKESYDASLREAVSEPRRADAIDIATDSFGPKPSTASATPSTASPSSASPSSAPRRRNKRDPRLAVALVVCIAAGIVLVLYINRQSGETVIAESGREATSSTVGIGSGPSKPAAQEGRKRERTNRSPNSRRAANAKIDNASPKVSAGSKREPSAGKENLPTAAKGNPPSAEKGNAPGQNNQRPGEAAKPSAGKNRKPPRTPKFISPVLSPDWLDPLTVVEASAFEARKGADSVSVEQNQVRLLPAGNQPRVGDLVAKGVTLDTSETVTMRTNFRAGLPDAMRIGLRVGPIRLQLESKRKNIQIKMLQQTLATWRAKEGAPLTIAISRDRINFSACQWLVTDGTNSIAGRAKINADAGLTLPVGIFYSTSKKKLDDPVWIDQLRVGKLPQQLVQGDTEVVPVKVRNK